MVLIRERYHLLDFPLSGEWIDKLLGRVVLDKESPTFTTAPAEDGPDKSWVPQHIVPDLADAPFSYKTMHFLLNEAETTEGRIRLTDFFKQEAAKRTSTDTTISAINVERIDISNVPLKLEKLMQNKAYAKSVRQLLAPPGEKRRSLGMVTGIFVSRGMSLTEDRSRSRNIGGDVTVPVGAIAGVPTTALDVGAGFDHSHSKGNIVDDEIEVLSVFAVAYTDVILRPAEIKTNLNPDSHRSFFRLRPKKNSKSVPEQEDRVVINVQTGSRIYHGSGSNSSSRSHTPSGSVDETTLARSTTSTHVEGNVTGENGELTFQTPDSVF